MMTRRKSRWHTFAGEAAGALRTRLETIATITPEEREQIALRLEQAIAGALEVPPDLEQHIEERVAELIAGNHAMNPVALAWHRTRDRARRTAAIGAVTAIPAAVPGVGSALAALGLVADWRYVAAQQRDLVLEIAALFGQWPENPTREARGLFLIATAAAFSAPGAGKMVSKTLARQVARRGAARLLPGAGAALAGALNYIATIAIGRAAIQRFAEQAGYELHGVVPEAVHPAMPWLRNAVVDALDGGQGAAIASEEARNAMRELSASERDELLDLATALSLAGGHDPLDDVQLRRLGSDLGFPADEIERTIEDTMNSTLPLRERMGNAIARVTRRAGTTAESVWRRVGKLARPARRPRRKARRRTSE